MLTSLSLLDKRCSSLFPLQAVLSRVQGLFPSSQVVLHCSSVKGRNQLLVPVEGGGNPASPGCQSREAKAGRVSPQGTSLGVVRKLPFFAAVSESSVSCSSEHSEGPAATLLTQQPEPNCKGHFVHPLLAQEGFLGIADPACLLCCW